MSLFLIINEIDWSITKDVFSIIGTIGALVIGSLGLFTWRRQLKGISEYELAKKAKKLIAQLMMLKSSLVQEFETSKHNNSLKVEAENVQLE